MNRKASRPLTMATHILVVRRWKPRVQHVTMTIGTTPASIGLVWTFVTFLSKSHHLTVICLQLCGYFLGLRQWSIHYSSLSKSSTIFLSTKEYLQSIFE
jgi:hypothetical protein